jgi:hypothetical protein
MSPAMRPVMVVWCGSGASEFERHIPLELLGHRARRIGIAATIDVVVLSGYARLGEGYRGRLEALDYRLHDAGALHETLARRYAALEQFGTYERNCFLRWPVLAELFPGEKLLHLDGDVVLNESPERLGRMLDGVTFVLQGCPAITAVSRPDDWFAAYRGELDRLASDVPGYSARAWGERDGWERSERDKWAGQRDRRIITSDQDLLSHLIHTDRILQTRPTEVLARSAGYFWFENPLYIDAYDASPPFRYERRAGADYINGMRVAFWHLQSHFSDYLNRAWFRNRFLPLARDRVARDAAFGTAHRAYRRLTRGRFGTRRFVCEHYFERRDLGEVFREKVWWKPGVFAT